MTERDLHIGRGWAELVRMSRPTGQRALAVATIGIWLADFTMMMSRALIHAYPHQFDVAIRRAIVCLMGMVICVLIYRVLDHRVARDMKRRLTASVLLSAIGALGYAACNVVAYFAILPRWGHPPYGVLSDIALVFGLHVWVYLACVTAYWTAHYSDELADKDRRLAEARSLMLDAQNRMLREQINPHFLFNTLNALSTLILQKDNVRAEKTVLALSTFLRRSLEKDPVAKTSLAEEIETAQEYLALEKLRFGDRLNLRVNAPASILDALTPGLILQPLLENAVKHGVSSCVETVTIDLVATSCRDRLMISVRDDGPGASGDQASLGIGLRNVSKRIEAIYGQAGRIEWGPVQPRGFEVLMEFTLERHDQAA